MPVDQARASVDQALPRAVDQGDPEGSERFDETLDRERVEAPVECASGQKTTLWRGGHHPLVPRHDGPEGETTFEVRDATGKRIVAHTLIGQGACRGYSAEAGAYVVSSSHETAPPIWKRK